MRRIHDVAGCGAIFHALRGDGVGCAGTLERGAQLDGRTVSQHSRAVHGEPGDRVVEGITSGSRIQQLVELHSYVLECVRAGG